MRHKHYDVLVAVAEGKPVEFSINGNKWTLYNPDQHYTPLEANKNLLWRIKKEPVIEVKYYVKDSCGDYLLAPADYKGIWHLKITYQDGKEVKAEVAE